MVHLPFQDDELLAQECIFSDEFGFGPQQIDGNAFKQRTSQVIVLVQRLKRFSAFSATWRRSDQRKPRRGSDTIERILLQGVEMSDQRKIIATRTA